MGLTQEQIADLLGMSRRQVINLETGTSQCTKMLGMFLLMLPYFEDKQIKRFGHDLKSYDIKEPAIE